MPSNHVCSEFVPGSPHFLNQAPRRKQQLRLPDLSAPHLEHMGVACVGIEFVVVVTEAVVVSPVITDVMVASAEVAVEIVVVMTVPCVITPVVGDPVVT